MPGLGDEGQAGAEPIELEAVAGDPPALLDAAHNPDGARALAEALPEVAGGRPVVACLAIASAGNLIEGGDWNLSLAELGRGTLFELINVMMGVAFGLVFMRSARRLRSVSAMGSGAKARVASMPRRRRSFEACGRKGALSHQQTARWAGGSPGSVR